MEIQCFRESILLGNKNIIDVDITILHNPVRKFMSNDFRSNSYRFVWCDESLNLTIL
jgi:hypothetical protein